MSETESKTKPSAISVSCFSGYPRQATQKDWKVMRDINLACLPENYPGEVWRMIINNFQEGQFVYEVKGKVVGYILTALNFGENTNPRCISDGMFDRIYVYSFAVLKKYRLLGIGRALMQKVQEIARKRNLPLYLNVRKSNVGAFKFYHRMGFKYKHMIDSYYTNPTEPGLIMIWK